MVFVIGEPVRLANEKRHRLVARMALFGLFCLAGAAGLGALLGLLGQAALPEHSLGVWIGVCALALFTLVRETVARALPLPQRRWQLPRPWTRSFWGSAVVYGGAMGMGIFTLTPSALFYAYLLSCLLVRSAAIGALIGLWYGVWFLAAVTYATIRWRDGRAGEQASRALRVLRWSRVVGAPASVLLVAFPAIWPY
jgi:hypothetical protein